MRKKRRFTELEVNQIINSELKDAKAYMEAAKAKVFEAERSLDRIRSATVHIAAYSKCTTYRPIAVREAKQMLIDELDRSGCIEYIDMPDGSLTARMKSVRCDTKGWYDMEWNNSDS